MSYSYKALQQLSDEEIVKLHDQAATSCCVGVAYYLDELRRREQVKDTKVMVDCTIQIKYMTAAMLVMTAIMIFGMIMK